ncbi:50S ribosomal protein L22 [archaeon AH-315-M20]|nr:50S ribosomal protein L22 [archaeon AH-315-M20]
MGKNYSFKNYNKENMARASGKSIPVSFKHSIEICNFIRGRDVNYAKNVLSEVINERRAIPFKRFSDDVGHKKNMAAGRYPKKASKEILDIINLVEANAQFKGLNTSDLVITHISPNKASSVTRFGRKRGRKAKRTNIEVVVQEKVTEKKLPVKKESKEEKKEVKVQDKKAEEKETEKVEEKQKQQGKEENKPQK